MSEVVELSLTSNPECLHHSPELWFPLLTRISRRKYKDILPLILIGISMYTHTYVYICIYIYICCNITLSWLLLLPNKLLYSLPCLYILKVAINTLDCIYQLLKNEGRVIGIRISISPFRMVLTVCLSYFCVDCVEFFLTRKLCCLLSSWALPQWCRVCSPCCWCGASHCLNTLKYSHVTEITPWSMSANIFASMFRDVGL